MSINWRLDRAMALMVPLALAACAATPRASTAAPPVAAADYQRYLGALASDEFAGRKPGTQGEKRTVEYLVEQFRAMGLEPGNGESWVQQVPVVEITAGSDARIKLGPAELRYPDDAVLWTRRVVSESSIQDSPLVFVGYGIVAPEYGWNDYAGLDMRGKTAVILVNDPGFATGDPALFRGRTMTYYGRWTYKFEEAARQGAAAALIIHETAPAAYPWETVQNGAIGPRLDLAAGEGSDDRRIPIEGWITHEAADVLLRRSGSSYVEARDSASRRGFKARELGQTASATVRNAIRTATSSNVIARLPGTRRPDEYVFYMAHWDHLGRSLARSGDNVFNGAVDNASGVAGMLAIARSFKEARRRPDRTLVFFAPTLEESGLLGSAYYVEHPLYPLANTVATLNMDAIDFGGPKRDVTVIGYGASELDGYLATAAQHYGRVLAPEPTPEKGFFFRSDHFNFAKAGVPSLYIKVGIDDVEHGAQWGREQLDDYVAQRYHKPSDEVPPDADLRGGLENLQLLRDVGERLAREKRFPEWAKDSEFRAARELSRKGARR
jgi:Zn-dependent M28 family amino/carboxypeptidase